MRVRLPLGRGLFFLIAFLFSAVALLPLRLAADWLGLANTGIAARDAVGSVWGGVFHGAQTGPTPLGDLVARLKALPLVIGRARVELGRNDGALARTANRADRFEGAVTVTRNSTAVGGVTARLPLGPALAPLPITAIDLSDVSARYVGGLCVSAEGAVTIETSGNLAGVPLPSSMTGNARCDRGALLLPLAGAGGMERLDLRVMAGGRYRATLVVRPADPALGQRLALAGFATSNGAYSFVVEGNLKP